MTDEDAARIGRLSKQQQAEELLARAIGHDNRALEMLENDVESWTSEVRLTDKMKQLDTRATYSTDLRVRQADADLWLAMEGWHHNQEAVGLLMQRIEQDKQYRPSAYYFLGMEGARGVDSEHAFAVLRDRALNDPDPVVRQWAVEGLRFFKTDDALDVLFHSFTHDSSYTVRDRAGCNLSDCGIFTRAQRMRFVPKLVELAEDRSLNSQMRNWVFMALREITDTSLPEDASAWRIWYKQHGAEKTTEFDALPWYQVQGDQ
jgi:HEAT repeat protein